MAEVMQVVLFAVTFVIGWCLTTLFHRHMKREREQSRRVFDALAFERRKAEVKQLSQLHVRHPHVFRAQRPCESTWNYAWDAYRYWYPDMRPPWQGLTNRCSMGRFAPWVTVTVKTYRWFTQDVDGIVHKVGAVKHDDTQTYVHWCDQLRQVETPVIQVEEHEEPLVTCLQCLIVDQEK